MILPPSTQKPRGSRARKCCLSLLALMATLALVELGIRTRQYVKHGTFGAMHVFVHDPETGLELPPAGRVTANFAINEKSFRGPLVESPKPAGRLRLAFLGASTTFCAEVSSEEKTWPALVAAAVAKERPSGGVDYVNAGVGGFKIEQIRINLEKRVAPLEPDVIFLYEATNDLTKDTRDVASTQKVDTGHSDEESWLSRYSLTWYLFEKNRLLRTREALAAQQQGVVQLDLRTFSQGYRARLQSLCDLAKAHSKLFVMLTFSTQVRCDQDPQRQFEACNTSFYYMPYMTPQLLLDAFDEYNRVIREVAAEKGALLIDVALAVPGDKTHFNDSVHFKDAGCAVFAEAVTRGLLDSPRFRELLNR